MFSFLLSATQLYEPESSSVTLLISKLLPPSRAYFFDLVTPREEERQSQTRQRLVDIHIPVAIYRRRLRRIQSHACIRSKGDRLVGNPRVDPVRPRRNPLGGHSPALDDLTASHPVEGRGGEARGGALQDGILPLEDGGSQGPLEERQGPAHARLCSKKATQGRDNLRGRSMSLQLTGIAHWNVRLGCCCKCGYFHH